MCFNAQALMWYYMGYKPGQAKKSAGWIFMVAWSTFVLVLGSFLIVAGTYGSVIAIQESLQSSGGSKPWGCADNSSS